MTELTPWDRVQLEKQMTGQVSKFHKPGCEKEAYISNTGSKTWIRSARDKRNKKKTHLKKC
jgi:hypothetical protein